MAQHNVSGREAEKAVANFLRKNGYKILDTNWKTSWCEIDIVAQKDQTIHFVEVKYRRSESQGSGFEYVHSKKLKQMERAANSWVLIKNWPGEYVLSAAEVTGLENDVNFIEEI